MLVAEGDPLTGINAVGDMFGEGLQVSRFELKGTRSGCNLDDGRLVVFVGIIPRLKKCRR